MKKYKMNSYEHDRQIAEEIGLCHKRKNRSVSINLSSFDSRIDQLKKLVKAKEHEKYTRGHPKAK